jgi:GNAT superfamily N-acetyltransferase
VIGMDFNYSAPGELFMPKRKGIGRRVVTSYRRFATAAGAVRFAVEEFPAVRTLGAWMQVGDQRYDSDEICRLYESAGYPLRRTLG